jgi:hypothetical protein
MKVIYSNVLVHTVLISLLISSSGSASGPGGPVVPNEDFDGVIHAAAPIPSQALSTNEGSEWVHIGTCRPNETEKNGETLFQGTNGSVLRRVKEGTENLVISAASRVASFLPSFKPSLGLKMVECVIGNLIISVVMRG